MAGHRAKQQEGTTVESVKQKGSSTKEENLTLFILTILLPPYIMLIPRSGQIYITKRRSRKK